MIVVSMIVTTESLSPFSTRLVFTSWKILSLRGRGSREDGERAQMVVSSRTDLFPKLILTSRLMDFMS